jgi:hypothetical protein
MLALLNLQSATDCSRSAIKVLFQQASVTEEDMFSSNKQGNLNLCRAKDSLAFQEPTGLSSTTKYFLTR